jgi:16S rRNA U1498 N3-methylase RsmE
VQAEVELFKTHSFRTLDLGPRILKVEHAVSAVLGVGEML